MADWPDRERVKRRLGITTDAKDEDIESALAAAIEGVVDDCGGDRVEVTFADGVPTVGLAESPADDEEPVEITVTHKLAEAALMLCAMVYKGPDAPFGVASTFDTGGIYVARHNPNYTRLLKGNRLRFGIA